MKKNPYEKIFEKKCSVCGKTLLVDQYGNGQCPHCTWYNTIDDGQNENCVIFPNVVSESKARKLVSEKKVLRPSVEDFLDMFYFYGETCFEYQNQSYCLFWSDDDQIEFDSEKFQVFFKDKDDFIENAKIDGAYVRDIWDQVENPKYM